MPAAHAPSAPASVVYVALDLLREAAARKWFLALGGAITLMLATVAFSLKLDVVDGALAATSFFGHDFGSPGPIPVGRVMGYLFEGVAHLVFYGGLVFGLLACSDFGPSLLSPGRIEHLLALPVRRWALLLGTFMGVLTLAVLGAVYGAGGLAVILGAKTGVWTLRPVGAAMLAAFTFSAVYASMLSTAVFVRSASLSAAVGGLVVVGGIVASYRAELARLFEPGITRASFEAVTLVLPHVHTLARAAGSIAGHEPFDHGALLRLLAGLVLFALAALAVGIWRFERKDY